MIDTTLNVCKRHTIQFSKYTDCTICNLLFEVRKLLDNPSLGENEILPLKRIIDALEA